MSPRVTLITGGAGFIGLAVVERLLAQGEHVTVFDLIDVPPDARTVFGKLPGHLTTIQGSVLEPGALDAAVASTQPSALVHAATVTPDGAREKLDPLTVNLGNFNGTLNVLEVVRHRKIRLIHLSTSGVYGEIQNRPGFTARLIDEDVLAGPRTLYAISKTAAEQTVQRYVELFGIDAVVARVGVSYGPWEYETGLRHVFSAPLQLMRLAHAGRAAVIARESLKDWSYSRDVARGIALLKDPPAALHARLFNVGGDTAWAITDFASGLAASFPGFSYRVATVSDDPDINVALSKASDRQGLDIGRLKRETGYLPAFDRQAALADYIAWTHQTHCWRAR